MTSEVFAPAKINLTLHVTGQRADGYHLLDSLVVFADLGDRLWFAPSETLSLTVTGPFADGVPTDDRNLVWQAAERAGQTAAITLEKNLPHGAGIGGGSSDAAAVLRHFGVTLGAGALGADVPVCLTPSAQRMRGIGDVLESVPNLPTLEAVLVNPGVHVPTPEVFKALDRRHNPPMPEHLPQFQSSKDFTDWLATQRNDLQAAAIAKAPQIADVLKALNAYHGISLARMSGSGATCFGLFVNRKTAENAAKAVADANANWWVRACRLS